MDHNKIFSCAATSSVVIHQVACTSWKRVLLMASGEMTVDRPEKLSMTFVHSWRITDRYFPRIRTFSLDQVNANFVPQQYIVKTLCLVYVNSSSAAITTISRPQLDLHVRTRYL